MMEARELRAHRIMEVEKRCELELGKCNRK